MEQEGFIEVSRGTTPGPRTMPQMPPPHQQHHGIPPTQGRPNIVNANPASQGAQPRMAYPQLPQLPQQQQQQQQQQYQKPGVPPPPPRDIVPIRLQKGPIMQLSDIRKERLTEIEAREELSEYFVFRLERADAPGVYDSDGEEVKPTWMNAYVTEMSGVSKKEASRQVRFLNETTQPLNQKRTTLIPAQLRQLDKVYEELALRERDPRFETVLVQIDRRLEKKAESRSRERERDRTRDPSSRKQKEYRGRKDQREYTTVYGKAKPFSSKDRKKILETVSITAYYKRTPLRSVDALALVSQQNADKTRQLRPPQPQNAFLPQQQQQPQQQQPQLQHQQQMRPQPVQYPQITHPGQHPGQHPSQYPGQNQGQGQGQHPGQFPAQRALPASTAFAQQRGPPASLPSPDRPSSSHRHSQAPIQIIQGKKLGKKASRSKSRSSSRASVSSRTDTSDESDDMSIRTPESSHSSSQQSSSNHHQHHHHHQHNNNGGSSNSKEHRRGSKRGRRRYIEEPGHFGVPTSVEPHKTHRYGQQQQQQQQQQHRISEDNLAVSAGPTRYSSILPSDIDLEQIKAEFYEAGRADERAETVEQLPRPRIMQPQSQPQSPRLLRLTESPMHHYPSDLDVLDEPPMSRAVRPRLLQRHHSSRSAYPDEADPHEDTLSRMRHMDLEDRVAYYEPRYVAGVDDAMLRRAERRRAREIAEDRMRQEMEMEAEIAREEEEFRAAESAREMEREYRLGGAAGVAGSSGSGRRLGRRREPRSEVTFADLDPPPSASNPFAPRPPVHRRATSGAFPVHRYEV